jgi:hypothetical protein
MNFIFSNYFGRGVKVTVSRALTDHHAIEGVLGSAGITPRIL